VGTLAAIGAPISTEEHIGVLLDGLSEEYEAFITVVLTRVDPYTVEEIEALLLSQEERLEKFKINESLSVNLSFASLFSTKNPRNQFSGSFNKSNNRSYYKNQTLNRNPKSFGFKNPNRSYWQTPSTSNSLKIQCQICNKFGHTAITCWHKYESGSQTSISANHSQCLSPEHSDTSSLLGTPSIVTDPLWYLDNGASHHITNNLHNFTSKTAYTGNETVKLGNGSGMPISHVGTSSLYSPQSNMCLLLSNLLHVPNISKNLISVSKFAKDNHVYLEFHANYYYVKKQDTNKIILKGFLRSLCLSYFTTLF